MKRMVGVPELRRYAIARSLVAPTTLGRAVARLGFVQADPIRAPACAQDLTLRQRVKNYRAGDLERRYARLDLEEGFFINYGFIARAHYLRMHPRAARRSWPAGAVNKRWQALLEYVREQGAAHPSEVEREFSAGRVQNYWGGVSRATTHQLHAMHYRGLLRVVRRERGVRIYAVQEPIVDAEGSSPTHHLDALIDVVVKLYAPVPSATLGWLVARLRYATPQWRSKLPAALARAKSRLGHARVDGVDWYWPANERPTSKRHQPDEQLRLLTPFDPVVWDRRRFALFWSWDYRFEAYLPAAKRKLGYYALALLWRDQVIGWANLSWQAGRLEHQLGFVAARPREPAFDRELEAELERIRTFLA